MGYSILFFIFAAILLCIYFMEINYLKKLMKEMEETNKMLLESIEKEKELLNKEDHVEHYNEVLEFINNYKPGTFVYPRVIKRHFNIDTLKAYEVLEVLSDKNVLKRVYQIECSNCGTIDDTVYETLNQIDEDVFCSSCRKDFHILEDVILYYKKN